MGDENCCAAAVVSATDRSKYFNLQEQLIPRCAVTVIYPRTTNSKQQKVSAYNQKRYFRGFLKVIDCKLGMCLGLLCSPWLGQCSHTLPNKTSSAKSYITLAYYVSYKRCYG